MKRRIFCFTRLISMVCVISCLFSFYGCGRKLTGSKEDLMRNVKAQKISAEAMNEDYMNTVSDFSVSLFQQSYSDQKNTMICPISVYLSLAMILNGAATDTREELEKVMGNKLERQDIDEYLYSLCKAFNSTEHSKFTLGNSIWINKSMAQFEPNKEFLQKNADYLGASAFYMEFNKQACEDMNLWIKKKTGGFIDHAVENNDLDSLAIILNTAYFDAKWKKTYKKDQLNEAVFHADNEDKTTKFMSSFEMKYISGDDVTGFIKPYDDDKYSFVALLPDEDKKVSDFVSDMTGEKVRGFIRDAKDEKVLVNLPGFHFKYKDNLKSALQQLGVKHMFKVQESDLSEMGSVSEGRLYIDKMIHDTYIKVDEKGTKAAAVTKVVSKGSEPVEHKVKLDRPFVFMIIDNQTELPLFIGTVLDPTIE